MKFYAEKTTVRHEPEAVRCNVCGKAVEKNEWGYFMDYLTLFKEWGYHSPYDGEAHEMDICVDCYRVWTRGFEIPPAAD